MTQATHTARLTGWASIGAYIGRDARTAQRYERERELPVRRMPGEGRSTVFALRAELDGWLLRHGEPTAAPVAVPPEAAPPELAAPPPQEAAAPPRRASRPLALSLAAALVAAGAVALAGAVLRAQRVSAAGAPALSDFDERAAAAWSERSPAGLARAIDNYTQAVVRNPSDPSAYAGLANSYNLAPEVMGMAPGDAYPRARAAAERALALAPRSADAHRALAFALFWWAGEPQAAEREFRRALALQPQSALTHHWYANALAARGDPRALPEVDRAMALSPSPALLADKGWILAMLGREAEAAEVLDEVVRLHPESAAAHQYLSLVARRRGDWAAELAETRRAAELRRDPDELAVLNAGAQALADGGRPALLRVTYDRRRALWEAGRGDPYAAAVAASDLRRPDDTLRLLAAARTAHAPAMVSLRANPDFAWLRGDPRFQRLAP